MVKRETIVAKGLFPRVSRSSAVRVGDLIWTAGLSGDDAKTGKVTGDIKEQTRKVLENLKILLEESGSSMKSVVNVSVYLANMHDRAAMNEVYREFFPPDQNPPTRKSFGGVDIEEGILLEIDAVAIAER